MKSHIEQVAASSVSLNGTEVSAISCRSSERRSFIMEVNTGLAGTFRTSDTKSFAGAYTEFNSTAPAGTSFSTNMS